jgi:lysophospholipid acyltransferase (LPLAT)-like uncharacterized protein
MIVSIDQHVARMPVMKIRNKKLIRILAWFAARIIRVWMSTLRYEYLPLGQNVDPHRPELRGRYLYSLWHETLLLPAYCYRGLDIFILISQHADGELIAEICRHLGFRPVRGSTTRGGIEAVRQMVRAGKEAHISITPDGPRGPRRQVQGGLIYLAARTGLPIVPAGFAFANAWRMKSWDRFALPKPGSLAAVVTDTPIVVPPDVDRDGIEHYRRLVENEMLRLTAIAERWAETGVRPIPQAGAQSA